MVIKNTLMGRGGTYRSEHLFYEHDLCVFIGKHRHV